MTFSPAPADRDARAQTSLRALAIGASLFLAIEPGLCPGQAAANGTYFEFGRVVALGQRTVEVQTFDKQKKRLVQHGFLLAKETKTDPVQVGETIEIIYAFTSTGDRTARRLIALPGGLPVEEQPPLDAQAPGPATGNRPATPGSPAAAPDRQRTAARAASPGLSTGSPQVVAGMAVLDADAAKRAVPSASAVDLGGAAKAPPPRPRSLSLGAPGPASSKPPASVKQVHQEQPSGECHRSDPGWPGDPIKILVIDFRYPTEREEAHDVGTTGGGSGTAVADLVFARMEKLENEDDRFLFARGDRRRLDRTDFAGAARIGRELGADAVLAGTFNPVANPADPSAPPARYELRAGLVDSCSGELLERLSSVACPAAVSPGIDPGVTAPGLAPCKRFSVSAADAADPKRYASAYGPLLDAMLYPLVHNGAPHPLEETLAPEAAGVVTAADTNRLTVRLREGVHLKAGDQLGIHADRLAKDTSTFTLHELHDQEIGRLLINHVQGSTVRGVFTGEIGARAGDTAARLQPE